MDPLLFQYGMLFLVGINLGILGWRVVARHHAGKPEAELRTMRKLWFALVLAGDVLILWGLLHVGE